jgi:protein SCO1/2
MNWRLFSACAGVLMSVAQCGSAAVLENVRIVQHVGEKVPLDLRFTDDEGHEVELRRYMADRPVVLVLAYYTCPNLCPMLQRHLTQGLNGIGLVTGRDFDVVVVSMDPADTIETARRQKLVTLGGYRHGEAAAGWHYLTGDASRIARLEEAVGFHCVPDPRRQQFAHALGAMVICPGGKLSHYFLGVDFSPVDLEAALKDAAAGQSTAVRQVEQQYCLDYTPSASHYGRVAVHALQAAAVVWVSLLLAYVARELRRDWRGGGAAAVKADARTDDSHRGDR